MKQTWIFVALLIIGLLMTGLACLSAVFLGDFRLFQALVGMALSLVGAIGYRMAKRQTS